MSFTIWSLLAHLNKRRKENLECGGEQLLLLDPLREDQVLRSNFLTSLTLTFAFYIKYVGSEMVACTMFQFCIFHPFSGGFCILCWFHRKFCTELSTKETLGAAAENCNLFFVAPLRKNTISVKHNFYHLPNDTESVNVTYCWVCLLFSEKTIYFMSPLQKQYQCFFLSWEIWKKQKTYQNF